VTAIFLEITKLIENLEGWKTTSLEDSLFSNRSAELTTKPSNLPNYVTNAFKKQINGSGIL
jgi:hypothetical protein